MNNPGYQFVTPNTLIFLTGAPLSGKSTIAPLVVASIEGCVLQSMDIIRLVAQEIETQKPESERNPFVHHGSCDSYTLIGDGSYSPEALIKGFNLYSEAVSSVLTKIIPKLEAQGARDVLFEGVQLTPSIVARYLTNNNKLIIITVDEKRLRSNREKLFGADQKLIDRYSTDKLLLLQEELLRQGRAIPLDKVLTVANSSDYTAAAFEIIEFLLNINAIRKI